MKTFNYKFIEKEKFWLLISLIIIITGFSLMALRSFQSKPTLNYGIDFIGGNTFLLKLNTPLAQNESQQINQIRKELAKHNLITSQIQLTPNNEIFIKTLEIEKDTRKTILSNLEAVLGSFEILEIDFIGPSIGKKLKEQSIWIILTVSILLLIYISLRFEFSFGISALAALLHDSLVIISISSILNLEINTSFIAAILTTLGYSINDTIVIFDRIREKIEFIKGNETIKNVTNNALNQTLLRTINTSITTLLVVLALIIFGGTTIKEFCIVLMIGILSGTYSSLCIASPLLVRIYKTNTNNETAYQ